MILNSNHCCGRYRLQSSLLGRKRKQGSENSRFKFKGRRALKCKNQLKLILRLNPEKGHYLQQNLRLLTSRVLIKIPVGFSLTRIKKATLWSDIRMNSWNLFQIIIGTSYRSSIVRALFTLAICRVHGKINHKITTLKPTFRYCFKLFLYKKHSQKYIFSLQNS